MTRRLVVSYVLLAAFILLVVELPLGLTFAGRAQDRLLADIERDARVLAGLVEERVEKGDSAGVARAAEQYARQTDGRVVITDATGSSIADSSRPGDPSRDFSTRPEMIAAIAGTQASGTRRSDTLDEELAYVAVPITSGNEVKGVVRVSFPTETVRRQVRDNWLRLGALSLLVLAAAASIGWLVAKWAVGPVQALEDGATRLARGDLDGRADVDRGPPELRHLADTFNEMAARLELLIGAQRAFVADASHQLRTPLTVLRLRIESLEDTIDVLDDAPDVVGDDATGSVPAARAAARNSARADLAAIESELDRLRRLVDGLLALARSETTLTIEVIDVAAVTRQAVERWAALAEEQAVTFSLDAANESFARCVAGGLEQMLDNVFDNAISVAPEHSSIDVTLRSGAAGVHIAVRDRGPGMDAADRERATDRFWRAPDAEPGGSGLGLAIVSELATVSGGSVRLDQPEDGPGLAVDICLPHPR